MQKSSTLECARPWNSKTRQECDAFPASSDLPKGPALFWRFTKHDRVMARSSRTAMISASNHAPNMSWNRLSNCPAFPGPTLMERSSNTSSHPSFALGKLLVRHSQIAARLCSKANTTYSDFILEVFSPVATPDRRPSHIIAVSTHKK